MGLIDTTKLIDEEKLATVFIEQATAKLVPALQAALREALAGLEVEIMVNAGPGLPERNGLLPLLAVVVQVKAKE